MKYMGILLAWSTLSACQFEFKKNNDRIRALNAMQQADMEFARLAEEKGFRKAFLEYMEADAIMLRDNYMPIIGADAVDYISSINDSALQLTWETRGGDISKSGDLGFTYGLYRLKTDTDSVMEGSYITVWRLQENGQWKFLLDAGTQGLGNSEPGEPQ